MNYNVVISNTKLTLAVMDTRNNKIVPMGKLMSDDVLLKINQGLELKVSDSGVPYLLDEYGTNITDIMQYIDNGKNNNLNNVLESTADLLIRKNKTSIFYTNEKSSLILLLNELHNFYNQVKSYMKEELSYKINVPELKYDQMNFDKVREAVRRMNEKAENGISILSSSENTTLFRESPSDKLFIRLPQIHNFQSNEAYSLISNFNLNGCFKPFGNSVTNIEDILNLNSHNYISTLISYKDLTKGIVAGSKSNNNKDVYKEEEKFYTSLCLLFDAVIEMEAELYGVTVEEFLSNSELLDTSRIIDYLSKNLYATLAYHFNQSGAMPIVENYNLDEEPSDDFEDNEDDDNEEKKEDSIKLSSSYHPNGLHSKTQIEYDIFIKELFKNRISLYGKEVLISIVQALRFGTKKPTKIFFGGNEFLDLSEMKLTSNSGNRSDAKLELTPEGNIYEVLGIITVDSELKANPKYFRDNDIANKYLSVPVGLVLMKSYSDNSSQNMIISLIDLVSNYGKDKDLTIDNLEVKDGIIKFTDSVGLTIPLDKILDKYNLSKGDDEFITYQNKSIVEFLIRKGLYSKTYCSLEMLQGVLDSELDRTSISQVFSESELQDNINMIGYTISFTIGHNYLNVITKVNDNLELEGLNNNLNNSLEQYSKVMNELEYYGELFIGETVPSEEPVLESNNTFNDSIVEEKDKENMSDKERLEMSLNSLIKNVNLDKKFVLVCSKEEFSRTTASGVNLVKLGNLQEDVIIGFGTVNTSPMTICLNDVNTPNLADVKAKLQSNKVKSNYIKSLDNILNDKTPNLTFENKNAMDYYLEVMKNL